MICTNCHGRGYVAAPQKEKEVNPFVPCSECEGTGIMHCCEGLVENQPNDTPGNKESS